MPNKKKLKKFSVEIRRKSVQGICVEVEAEDADDAENLAVEKVEDMDDGWESLQEEDTFFVEEIK